MKTLIPLFLYLLGSLSLLAGTVITIVNELRK